MPGERTLLFVSYSGLLGGAERLLVDVVSGLDRPTLVACPPGALAEHARAAGLQLVELRERPLELRGGARTGAAAGLALAGHAREARRLVRELDPAALVAWGMRSGIACAAALRGLRRRPQLVLHHNDLLPGPLVGAAVRAAARAADAVVAVSAASARELPPGAETIHPGVDLERFRPAPLPDGRPTALVLGALVEWKRPDLALEAAALAARELPGLRVVLAGPPPGAAGERVLAALRERAARPDLRDVVEIPGPVDARAALADAHCLLHCAEREPFGMALVEALACGRPVAAPAAHGPAEIVTPECGRLYTPGDPVAAARALVELLGDPDLRERLGACGRERAERLFDREATRARYRDLLARLSPPGERGR
ncbi:MAG: glycosyltransferase, partial [Thermoleophilaceae bacterium]|nr:glycosyltransferase [Thermoleophilaceae bacterium]